jgi:hypothetical protein
MPWEHRQELARDIRRRIESIIDELRPLNPTPETAESAARAEVGAGMAGSIGGGIAQTLDGDTLENYIPLINWGGGFGVTGRIRADKGNEGSMRTTFKSRGPT